jgi:hypothetical protein
MVSATGAAASGYAEFLGAPRASDALRRLAALLSCPLTILQSYVAGTKARVGRWRFECSGSVPAARALAAARGM